MVVVGLTEMLPSRARGGPALITTLSAPVVVQLRVVDSPAVIEVDVAETAVLGSPVPLSVHLGAIAADEWVQQLTEPFVCRFENPRFPMMRFRGRRWNIFSNASTLTQVDLHFV